MAEILRVKLRWAGFGGAPGYSIFHFRDFDGAGDQNGFAQGAADRVRTFANDIKGLLPYQATLTVEPDVEVIEDTNGQLVDVVSVTPPIVVNSVATAGMNMNAAVGAVITWRTQLIRNGRRIRGRTFLVPLVSATFTDAGVIAANNLAQLNVAANSLRNATGSPDLGVYARPSGPGATDGMWAAVTSHSIPAVGAVLRSRRD